MVCVFCEESFTRYSPDDVYCEQCHNYFGHWFEGFELAIPKPTIASMVRLRLIPDSDLRCYLCGRDTEHREVEHVYPTARGGDDSFPNIGLACRDCNIRKGAKIVKVAGDSLDRLKSQQATFLRCFHAARKHLPDAFRQAVTATIWEIHCLDEFPLEPGELTLDDVAEAVVEAVDQNSSVLWRDPPHGDYFPEPFVELCFRYGEPMFYLYADRGWLSEKPTQYDIGYALGLAVKDFS